jgi:hypothetical protein
MQSRATSWSLNPYQLFLQVADNSIQEQGPKVSFAFSSGEHAILAPDWAGIGLFVGRLPGTLAGASKFCSS